MCICLTAGSVLTNAGRTERLRALLIERLNAYRSTGGERSEYAFHLLPESYFLNDEYMVNVPFTAKHC